MCTHVYHMQESKSYNVILELFDRLLINLFSYFIGPRLSAHNPKIFCLLKQIFAPVRNALHLFKLSLHFFYIVKVTKSSHHLSHDQASKGHRSIPCLMSQTDLHCIKSL